MCILWILWLYQIHFALFHEKECAQVTSPESYKERKIFSRRSNDDIIFIIFNGKSKPNRQKNDECCSNEKLFMYFAEKSVCLMLNIVRDKAQMCTKYIRNYVISHVPLILVHLIRALQIREYKLDTVATLVHCLSLR